MYIEEAGARTHFLFDFIRPFSTLEALFAFTLANVARLPENTSSLQVSALICRLQME